MSEENTDKSFKFASSLIKVIAIVIALMVLIISRYAFIFFAAAMLPTVFAIFFDKNSYDLIGWQTEDIYQNLVVTYIFNAKKNSNINNKIFKLPQPD